VRRLARVGLAALASFHSFFVKVPAGRIPYPEG